MTGTDANGSSLGLGNARKLGEDTSWSLRVIVYLYRILGHEKQEARAVPLTCSAHTAWGSKGISQVQAGAQFLALLSPAPLRTHPPP